MQAVARDRWNVHKLAGTRHVVGGRPTRALPARWRVGPVTYDGVLLRAR